MIRLAFAERPVLWPALVLPIQRRSLLNLRFSHHLSFAHFACVNLILFVLRLFDAELTLTRQTRRTPALYCPKRVQMPRITIAAGCSRGGVIAVYVSTFFLSPMTITHLVRTQ